MRIPSEFGKRTISKEIKRERPKIYLMYEGEKTEVQYFNKLIDSLNEAGTIFLFEPVPLLRSYRQRTNSHPNNILKQIQHFKKDKNKYKYLKEILIDYFIYELKICEKNYTEAEIIKIIDNICCQIMKNHSENENISDNEVLTILQSILNSEFSTESQIQHFKNYLIEQINVKFFPNDRICLIIDGDHKSVNMEENFVKLINLTKELNIELYITNPNFEFWLLLHTDNVNQYNNVDLLENKWFNSSKRYLEKILSIEFEGYNKSNIKPERFIINLDKAINNAKNYCTDINRLNTELGSNVGNLIKSIIKSK